LPCDLDLKNEPLKAPGRPLAAPPVEKFCKRPSWYGFGVMVAKGTHFLQEIEAEISRNADKPMAKP
jgi:hypothetical protein